MKKRFLGRILSLCCTLALVFPGPAVRAEEEPQVSAKGAVLMEASTGRVIWSQGGEERLSMASTTKIMTALLTLEQPGLDELFTVNPQAIKVEGTSMGLTEGAQATLRTLAAGMLLASGNDAANAAAVRIAGTQADFVMMMNRRAAQLGMKDTNFETPSGLDGQSHYSTARDMALLARAALQNEDFRAICSQSSMKLSYGNPPADRWLSNHNRLLKEYPGCIGLKTGFTKKSGRCLVSAAEREGVTLICVTLSDPNDWQDHTELLDWGFSKVVLAPDRPEQLSVPVTGGVEDIVIAACSGLEPCVLAEEVSRVTWEVEVAHFLYAPVQLGQQVGTVRCLLDGEEYFTAPLTAQQPVEARLSPEKTGLWERLWQWVTSLFEKG